MSSALHTSPDGSLWVGTGGLSRFVPGTGQWQTYTTRDGLASDDVQALHSSPDGALWVGTGGGLSRFMPTTGQWQTYTTRDGLASDDVQALHASPDGTLWVGTLGRAELVYAHHGTVADLYLPGMVWLRTMCAPSTPCTPAPMAPCGSAPERG